MNAAEVGRRTGLTHPAASAVLTTLASLRIVDSAPAGRGHTYWLNRDNAYVRAMLDPVFRAEHELPDAMLEAIRRHFEDDASSVVLFGSYARGDQNTESDVDVIAVAYDAQGKQRIEENLLTAGPTFRRMFGATLSAIVYEPAEAASLAHRAPALYESLLSEGIRVAGLSVMEWGRVGAQ